MIDEGELFSHKMWNAPKELYSQVLKDLIRTDLWRDQCLAPKGQGLHIHTPYISYVI